MATSTTPCGICHLRHITKPSLVWCLECEEGFCADCKEYHGLFKCSRKHDTLPIAEHDELPSFVKDIKQICGEHHENFQFYCKVHDCPCCRKCVLNAHKECREIIPLEDIIQNVKSSSAFEDLETVLREMQEDIKKVISDRQDNLCTIIQDREKIEKEIKSLRDKINSQLDQLQEKLIAELYDAAENSSKKIKKVITLLLEEENRINEYRTTMVKIKKYSPDFQAFRSFKQIERDLIKNEENIQSLLEDEGAKRTLFSFQIDSTLQGLIDSLQDFGKIVIDTSPCSNKISTRKNIQAQKLTGKPPASTENISLSLQNRIIIDRKSITGCSVSPSGKMAFVNSEDPTEIIITSSEGSIETRLFSPTSNAFDLTFIDDNTVAMTSNKDKCVILFDIKNKETKKRINTESTCWGITHKDGSLIFCGEGVGLQIITVTNFKINTLFKFDCRSWSYVTSLDDKFFYADGHHTVSCITTRGCTLWTFFDKSVVFANGISADDNGNVFVADHGSFSVIVISPDGKQHRKLLLPENTIHSPVSLCYDRINSHLLIANDKDTACLFQVNI